MKWWAEWAGSRCSSFILHFFFKHQLSSLCLSSSLGWSLSDPSQILVCWWLLAPPPPLLLNATRPALSVWRPWPASQPVTGLQRWRCSWRPLTLCATFITDFLTTGYLATALTAGPAGLCDCALHWAQRWGLTPTLDKGVRGVRWLFVCVLQRWEKHVCVCAR